MEGRLLLATADGTGPVVVGLTQRPVPGGAALVVSFDGPLDPGLAQDPNHYRVEACGDGRPEFVTEGGPSLVPRWARYDAGTNRVTLGLARPLRPGVFHRIEIGGTPGSGLTGADGTLFDGDVDDTPGGDFYALFARRRGLRFADPSSIGISGLINAVIGGGDVASQVRQIRDPRLEVTGGQMDTIDGRTYLVFGQDFQGGYSFPATATHIYTDEVRSFRIVDDGGTLAIADYVAQRDPVNFRRRDYPLAPVIDPDGRPGLTVYAGVFTPDGNAHRNPVEIGPGGTARVDTRYRQYFSQYDTAKVALFDVRDRSMNTIFFGGISLYHYDFASGTLTQDPELPFVNDVTTLVRRADGSRQEYIMPSQLPARLGAESAFFASPGLPTFENGGIQLDQLSGPTTLGYIYGGIISTVGNTQDPLTQTTASNLVFKVTLVPR